MAISLKLNEYKPNVASEPLAGDKLQKAKTVKTLGIVALALALIGIFIP